DYVDPAAFGQVLDRLERCAPVALALFDFDFVDEGGRVTKHVTLPGLPKDAVFSFGDYAGKLHDGPDRWVWIHNAIYRREFLEQIRFACHEHHYYVDMEYITYPLAAVGDAVYFPLRARFYLVGRGGQSVALSSRVRHFDQYREVVEFLVDFDKRMSGRAPERVFTASVNAVGAGGAGGDGPSCGADPRGETRKEVGAPSRAVLDYTRRRTAEFVTGVYSTLFGFPDRKEAVQVAREFDAWLLREAPEIYQANESAAVKLLRLSRFSLLGAGAAAYRMRDFLSRR
nr:hypothetical protein [Lachnospiraceae bacterium]